MGKIDLVVLVPLVGAHGKLVGAGLADQLDDVSNIEAALNEFLLKVCEQFGIGRRVAGSNVVDGIDDTNAEEVAPKAVDVALGEISVVD